MFRRNQHVVGDRFGADGDGEQGAEGGVPRSASVEAEDELVEIGLQVFPAQPVIDPTGPAVEVGEHLMDPGQDKMCGHGADDVGIVLVDGDAGISGPSIGLGGAGRGDVTGDEGVETAGTVVGESGQAQSARLVAVAHLDATDHEQLAVMASPGAAAGGVVLGPERQGGFVDLDQPRQRIAVWIDHRPAQFGGQHPGRAIGPESELLLQLKGGDAVRMGRHQIGRPEPDRQIELAAVEDRPRGHRGLAMAAGAFEGVRLGSKRPAMIVSATRALEALGPAHRE